MADAVGKRGDTCRIRNGHVDRGATLHSTRDQQAACACFDPGVGIALATSLSLEMIEQGLHIARPLLVDLDREPQVQRS